MGKKSKTTVLGTQQYINFNTGELVDMQVVRTEVPDADANFYKLFMRDFIATLDLIGNKQIKVCNWIIDNLNKDNILIATYRQISDKTGISYRTVAQTVKTLIDADFLRRYNTGSLIVNPDIIFKGSHSRRCNVLNMYQTAETGDEEANMEQRLKNIQETISSLQKQAAQLQQSIDSKKKHEPADDAAETTEMAAAV